MATAFCYCSVIRIVKGGMVFGVQRLLLVEAGEALTAHCGDLADAQEEPLAKIELFLPATRPEVFP